MKFKMQVSYKNKSRITWWETCDIFAVDTLGKAVEHSEALVERFNATLRPGETPRVFTGKVRLLLGESVRLHTWEKASLVTESGGYDRMRCTVCLATGKRYGLGQGGIKLDKGFTLVCSLSA